MTTLRWRVSGGHSSRNWSITVVTEPGYYAVQVGDLSGEFQTISWFNWWLTGGLAAGFILLCWLAWYYGFFRRRHLQAEGS